MNINNDSINTTTDITWIPKGTANDKVILHDILGKLWDIISAYLFTINDRKFPCDINYHSTFLIVKKLKNYWQENLVIQTFLQNNEYQTSHINIIQLPKQWPM